MSSIKTWLYAAYPWSRIETAEQAKRGARIASFGLILAATHILMSWLFLSSTMDDLKQALLMAEGPVALEDVLMNTVLFEKVARIVVIVSAICHVGSAVVAMMLAWIQWHRQTLMIPILAGVVCGLVVTTVVQAYVSPHMRPMVLQPENILHAMIGLIVMLLMVSGYRGAKAYRVLKEQDA